MNSFSAIELIQRMVRGQVALNVPMSTLTSVRTGGHADILITPADVEDLSTVLKFLAQRGIKYFVLGGGSGIIVRDGGIRGAVIRLGPNFQRLEVVSGGKEPVLRAQAGLSLTEFVRKASEDSIGGFEFLYGIPGTVGGAVARNASSWGEEIAGRVVSVDTINMEGEISTIPAEKLKFHRHSCGLPQNHIILSVTLRGAHRTDEEIRQKVRESLDRRMAVQPVRERSTGMIFVDPEGGGSAGALIDQCNLKGIRVGDAEISNISANYIVNLGEATTSNVIALVGLIQERIYVKHKLHLKTFIEIIGSRQQEMLRIKK
ncbi:UDP-N-acetylmuramate dehydrogenase [bacterium]|nr:MAG: UDP-N-acetylmuramate dehydrogenase [bacterium]